jgi:hypothetical protein
VIYAWVLREKKTNVSDVIIRETNLLIASNAGSGIAKKKMAMTGSFVINVPSTHAED